MQLLAFDVVACPPFPSNAPVSVLVGSPQHPQSWIFLLKHTCGAGQVSHPHNSPQRKRLTNPHHEKRDTEMSTLALLFN